MYRAYHTVYKNQMPSGPYMFFDVTLQSPAYQIMNPKTQFTFGKAGTFTFEVPFDNHQYEKFEELNSFIDLYREDTLIFTGRVLSQSKRFDNIYSLTCEGALAFFNDSLAIDESGNPLEYIKTSTIKGFINKVLSLHRLNTDYYKANFSNSSIISASDLDAGYFVTFSKYSSLMNVLDAFVNQYGGYFEVTKNGNTYSLNYYEDHAVGIVVENPKNAQSIDFGKNLLDLSQETNSDELATILYVEGKNRTVKVENSTAISKFGRISKHISFPDVDGSNEETLLKQLGNIYLEKIIDPKITINASAVDMAKAGSDLKFFQVGQLVKVNSEIHGIKDREFVIKTYDLDILNPASSSISLGSERNGYISRSKTSEENVYNEINNISPITTEDIERIIEGLS